MKYAVVFASLLLAACSRSHEDYSHASPAQTSTTTQPGEQSKLSPVAPPQTDRPSTAIAPSAAQTIDVQLTEYTIRMPQSPLAPGRYSFNIANAGHEDHGFTIEGPHVHLSLAQSLKRGDTANVTTDLFAGTYQISCPVDGHKGKGMSTTLTVK